jgi:enoyl-CoA hydratase/carnithine racemase
MSGEIQVAIDEPVGVITIAQPARRNALTIDMWGQLAGSVQLLDADPAVRVIVIRGEGGHFSAGVDLRDLAASVDLNSFDVATVTSDAEQAISAARKPVIAAIEGYALGGGALIAAAADLRVASQDAVLGFPPAHLGIVYPASSTRNLVRLIGPARTKLLLMGGSRISADNAVVIGMVDTVLSRDRFAGEWLDLARELASRSLLSQMATKRVVEAVLDAPATAEAIVVSWTQREDARAESREGIDAFLERRPVQFPSWRTTSGPHAHHREKR